LLEIAKNDAKNQETAWDPRSTLETNSVTV